MPSKSRDRRDAVAHVCVHRRSGCDRWNGPGAESDFDPDARTKAHQTIELRRVWVLSEPDGYGYGSGSRAREIVIYELVCEQGKITKVSEGFETGSGPKFGEGWVLRTQAAPSAAAAQEQLHQALADVCGI